MIFESDEFKELKDYDKARKQLKNRIAKGLNVKTEDFHLTQRLYKIIAKDDNDIWVNLVSGPIWEDRNAIKAFKQFTIKKFVSYDIAVKIRGQNNE